MTRDVTTYGSRGVAPGGHELAHHSNPDGHAVQAMRGERQHSVTEEASALSEFEDRIGSMLSSCGFDDPQLALQVAQAGESLLRVHPASGSDVDLPKTVAAFVTNLASQGVKDSKTLAVAAVLACIDTLMAADTAEDMLDAHEKDKARVSLKESWGSSFDRTLDAVRTYVNNELPASLADAIWQGRDSSGMAVANSPAVMLWLARLALGQSGPGPGGAHDALVRERQQIEHVMKTNMPRYRKDAAMRRRYLEILRLLGA